MKRQLFALNALASATAASLLAAGCGGGNDGGGGSDSATEAATAVTPVQSAARVAAEAAPGGASSWSSADIARNPEGYIADTVAQLDAKCARLREIESKLQAQLQGANREIASLKSRENEARLFWRAAKPVFDDPATAYPAMASGRHFGSRDALKRELVEANRTVTFATNALSKIENNAANLSKALSRASANLAEASAQRLNVARKADAIKAAAVAADLKEISALCSSIFADAEAALPDDELFAPSVDFLGDDGGESELEGISL